jgi:hypothetical protein
LWKDADPDGAAATIPCFPDTSFDFVLEQWADIGVVGHAEQVDAWNVEKDSRIMRAATLALERIARVESATASS